MTAADPPGSHRHRIPAALRDAYADVRSAVEAAFDGADWRDPAFADAFEEWAGANGLGERDRDEQIAIAATQWATLLLQRVLRYETDNQRPGAIGADASGEEFDDAAARLFASLHRDERVRRSTAELARAVECVPNAGRRGNLPGELYEAHIPDDERRTGGQFYTPPAIAEALVRWALRPGDTTGADRIPTVVDPAAGCGTFLGAAYRYFAERFPDAAHDDLLDHLVAVDIERFPLRLTALNLASRGGDGAPRGVRAYHGSFFDLEPGLDSSADDRIDGLGSTDAGGIGPVDAVVGNPPYVEADDLAPDVEHFRDHLGTFGPDGAAPYVDGPDAIPGNADAYVYFVTQATRFLDDGGRLAFVVPTKWLSSRYGEGFRAFLDDHYQIRGIVGFDARAFEDALVDASLLLLERCSDPERRRENVVSFVQLREGVAPGRLLDAVDDGVDVSPGVRFAIEQSSTHRTVGVGQPTLVDGTPTGSVARFLFAPGDLLDLLESPELTPLGDLAAVKRGAMTGSTAFFFPDGEDVAAHGIEDQFLAPALKSMRGCDTIAYDEADVDRWFVDVHGYVEAVRERSGNEPLEERVKAALAEDGYDGLLAWIRRAETEGEHRGATCERREVWFDFGEPPRPEILFQKLLRERLFSIYNRTGAVPSNAVDCVDVHPDVDSRALFGVLNSSIVRAIMEVRGRNEAGMLQLMTYETRSLPVPDVRSMSEAQRAEIAAVVDDVLDAGSATLAEEHRDRLDAAVLAALDSVELSVERVQRIQASLLERRVESGASSDVLVGRTTRPADVSDG